MNGSVGEYMEAYGMMKKVSGTGINGVCDCKQPLTILFFTISVIICCLNVFSNLSIWVLSVLYTLYYMV